MAPRRWRSGGSVITRGLGPVLVGAREGRGSRLGALALSSARRDRGEPRDTFTSIWRLRTGAAHRLRQGQRGLPEGTLIRRGHGRRSPASASLTPRGRRPPKPVARPPTVRPESRLRYFPDPVPHEAVDDEPLLRPSRRTRSIGVHGVMARPSAQVLASRASARRRDGRSPSFARPRAERAVTVCPRPAVPPGGAGRRRDRWRRSSVRP